LLYHTCQAPLYFPESAIPPIALRRFLSLTRQLGAFDLVRPGLHNSGLREPFVHRFLLPAQRAFSPFDEHDFEVAGGCVRVRGMDRHRSAYRTTPSAVSLASEPGL